MERPKKIKNNIRFSIESDSCSETSETQKNQDENNSCTNNNNTNNINSNENDCNKITFEKLFESIPQTTLEKIKDSKVKYAFITKGTIHSTSKQHKFKQPVSLEFAIHFLADSNVKDSTLVFINDNSLIFSNGCYDELDIFDESD
ncbi:hypothetical protein DICPUDRAFT_84166 [Dictyostelium purpureum]|uniref:Uncharacterized protein n=1 Tax=Dictyostelium purpureum TaxID=5786 RepID=F1A1S3_DICPU|nr:uncharacterized protein DICPUDRAFT_84166 [Dictyostelium purpureum]EGC29859.1 hypothetical protein DICPUDRAFT_84166 [Dictyostelium purpureum]|eukprot:XP_003293614.1 hypothetical protein DICPUDRAFT_84166 [Dictyostelium purpureum]